MNKGRKLDWKYFIYTFLFLTIVVVISRVNIFSIKAANTNNTALEYISNRVVVKYKDNVSTAQINSSVAGITALVKTTETDRYLKKLGNIQVLEFKDKVSALQYVEKVKNSRLIDFVEPVYLAKVDAVSTWNTYTNNNGTGDYPSDFENPDDPYTGRHWYIEKTWFPQFWHRIGCASGSSLCLQDSSVVVAIIDTGLAVDGTADSPTLAKFTYYNSCTDENNDGQYSADECLLPIAEEGYLDFELQFVKPPQIDASVIWTNPNEATTPECNDLHGVDMEMFQYNNEHNIASDCTIDNRQKEGIPADDFGHGTIVAEIIAASIADTSTAGPLGMTPNIKIMPIKVNIPFTGTLYLDRIAAGIVYAVDNGANVINISASTPYDSQLIRDAIQYALDHNVMVIASSGNSGVNSLAYPAAYTTEYSNVIAVASLDADGSLSGYSNYVEGITYAAYVGSTASKTNGLQSITLSCEMNETNCAAQKDTDGIYKKTYDTFNDSVHIGTSFAAPQMSAAVANLYTYDPLIKIDTIRRLLHQEKPNPTLKDMIVNMYQYSRLPYFSGSKTVLGNDNYPADDYIKQKPYWHKLNITPRTFVFGKRDWSNGIQVVQVNPGESGDNKIAWWYTYDSATKVSTSKGLSNTRSLIPDFGNDKTDVFFMADLVGPVDDGYQDAGKDAVVVRFNPIDSGTNLQVYVASHEVKIINASTYEVAEKLAFYNKVLDTNLTYSTDQLSAYMSDLNNDGHEDLIIRVDDSGQSTWLGYLAVYDDTGALQFGSQIILANNIDTTNRTFFVEDVTGDGRADLVYGQEISDTVVTWYVRENTGTETTANFGSESQWKDDFGNKGDIFYMADVNGDGKKDLLVKKDVNEDTVAWYVVLSQGDRFGATAKWSSDFGNYGDTFYFSDIDGDGKDDIIVIKNNKTYVGGQSLSIYTKLSSGDSFGGPINHYVMPDYSDIVLIGDFTGDGLDDIAIGRPLGSTIVSWVVSVNSGNIDDLSSLFIDPAAWYVDFGNPGDRYWVADLNGDGKKDLLLKRVTSDTVISWYGVLSDGTKFTGSKLWSYDFGNNSVNDHWYVGDFTGDGKDDLALARRVAVDQVRWYVEVSNGSTFNPWTIWREDFGNDFVYDSYYTADVTGDGKSDIALARVDSTNPDIVIWYVVESNGSSFVNLAKWSSDFGRQGDEFLLGDFYNHGKMDILLGRKTTSAFDLYLAPSWGNTLGPWIDPGEGIDHFYTKLDLLHLNNDGQADVFILDTSPYGGVIKTMLNRRSL